MVEVIDPQDFVVTTLTETEVGYIIHDYPCPGTEAAEDGPYIRGFTYSADLAGQKFYQLTGVSLTEEEITGVSV